MKIKLAIDAGHGMHNRQAGRYDPGAVCGGVTEADVALAWALTLKHVAVACGVEVAMLRRGPEDGSPVGRRAKVAESLGCTHYLSLHCNAAANPLASGSEVYYRDVPDNRLAVIALDSCVLAMGRKNRGLKQEGESQHTRLAVLAFDGPAALLEIGFVTNPVDRRRMLDRDVRLAFATEFVRRLKEQAR